MTAVCDGCGALLGRSWSRWHRPDCPHREPLERVAHGLAHVERRIDRVLALLTRTETDRSTT